MSRHVIEVATRPNKAHPGHVYFLAAGSPEPLFVKIGYTRNAPDSRIKSLQTGCPYPIRLLGAIVGGPEIERELHDRLSECRAHGEWFEWGFLPSFEIECALEQGVAARG